MVGMMFDRLSRALKAFWTAKAGNVAITFGLAVVPVIGMAGAAVDYSRASRIKAILMAAADAASVGSIARSSIGYATAAAMPADGPVPLGQVNAINIFNGAINGKTGFTLAGLSAAVTKTNSQLTSTVEFTATIPTVLMEVLGWNALTVSGSSSAANGTPAFIDFYLLLDNTPSMGSARRPPTSPPWSATRRTNAPSPVTTRAPNPTTTTAWRKGWASPCGSTCCAAPRSS